MAVKLDGEALDLDAFIRVVRGGERAVLSPKARKAVARSRRDLEGILASDSVAYGIKTGFGELCSVAISRKDSVKLQRNLVRSHAAGVGAPYDAETVRGILLLRANALAKGCSGVRPVVIDTLLAMLNSGVLPVIPSQGSVGASGDLAPLAHMSLVVIGEGRATFDGREMPGDEAMAMARIETLELQEKEGLALLNGTAPMASLLALSVADGYSLLRHAVLASAMSVDACKASVKPFDPRIHKARPHKGQTVIAGSMRALLKGSRILASHRDCSKVQDAYTLRCIPQVLGPVLDTLDWVKGTVETEMNSATDNPLIFGGESISGGNFHGEPLALASDFLGIALSEVASFSERRTARLVDQRLSGLPAFLTENGGINSGYMIAQYVAASLASENKVLAHPASVDSIPTSANQEDHVSMGNVAARKLRDIVRNSRNVVAIELVVATQALDFHKPGSSRSIEGARRLIRTSVPHLYDDRVVSEDIRKVVELMDGGALERAAGLPF